MTAPSDLAAVRALQHRFAAHLRAPERASAPIDIDDARMRVYRDLVFSNMENFISANFPIARSLYDDDEWASLTREFLREHRCRTPLFPQFGREFLAWLETRQEQGRDDPPFLLELAHYEWAELALSLDEADLASIPHDPQGDPLHGIPIVSPLACVLAYRFPVHRIAPDFRPTHAPTEPTLLLLVRGRDDIVRFHDVDTLSALLIERLQQNDDASGRDCLTRVLEACEPDRTGNLRLAGEAMLYELKKSEVILGTRV